MKKLTGIKIIKRANQAKVAAHESKTRNSAFTDKQTERELAGRIGGWVKDLRERRRGEEIASRRRFFGKAALVAATA